MSTAIIIYQALSRAPLGLTADVFARMAGIETCAARVILNAAVKEHLCTIFDRGAFENKEMGRPMRVFVPTFQQGELF
jgi:hypothetical protein